MQKDKVSNVKAKFVNTYLGIFFTYKNKLNKNVLTFLEVSNFEM